MLHAVVAKSSVAGLVLCHHVCLGFCPTVCVFFARVLRGCEPLSTVGEAVMLLQAVIYSFNPSSKLPNYCRKLPKFKVTNSTFQGSTRSKIPGINELKCRVSLSKVKQGFYCRRAEVQRLIVQLQGPRSRGPGCTARQTLPDFANVTHDSLQGDAEPDVFPFSVITQSSNRLRSSVPTASFTLHCQ